MSSSMCAQRRDWTAARLHHQDTGEGEIMLQQFVYLGLPYESITSKGLPHSVYANHKFSKLADDLF